MRNLFDKLYDQATYLSRPESIQSRIDQMYSALSESSNMVSSGTKEYCSDLLARTKKYQQSMIDEKKRVQEEKKAMAAEEQRERKEERRLAQEKKKATTVKKMQPSDTELSEHRRMVAEQRRLMTDSLRYDILVRDGFRCKICGASAADGVKLHVDHILPVSKGGKTEKSNLRTLCERCNLGKSDKIESLPVPCAPVRPVPPAHPVSNEKVPESHDWSKFEAIRHLTEHSIRYVDNTDRGGCFWIELTPESQALLTGRTIDGKKIYTAKRSKAFSNAPAMFIK